MNEKITNFLEKLETHLKNKSEAINFRDLEIPYVAKGLRDSVADAVIFGGTVEQYQFWRPHVCAVCCLKMVGDAARLLRTLQISQHYERRCRAVLQPAKRQESDTDLRSILATFRLACARIEVCK